VIDIIKESDKLFDSEDIKKFNEERNAAFKDGKEYYARLLKLKS
jgi:hypothetical protein